MLGIIIAAYHLSDLEASSITSGEVFDLTPGACLQAAGGLLVYDEVPAVAVACVGRKPIVLTVEYETHEILTKPSGVSGVLVSGARLRSYRFHDMQDRIAFDHILHHDMISAKRDLIRGECLTQSEFPRKYALLQGMRKEIHHVFPMENAYLCTETTLRSMGKRVIKAQQQGDATCLYSKAERLVYQLLEQTIENAKLLRTAHHVTHGVVDNKFLFRKKTTQDELIYDANKPLRMFALIDVDAEGVPTLAPKS